MLYSSVSVLIDIIIIRTYLFIFAENSESWKWDESTSEHRNKFTNLIKYGKENADIVMEINGVRFCCLPEFCIGQGSDGTRVYVGLGKYGYERAVKRLLKDACASSAENEIQILEKIRSKNVVRYWSFDDESSNDYVFLVLDLCEETLESYVDRESSNHLATTGPEVVRQV